MREGPTARPLRAPFQWALDLLLPPRCLGCGAVTDEDGRLCLDCWQGLDLLGPPLCRACGYRFEIASDAAALCGACLRWPPPYERARAALAYDDGCRQMILRFKHGDRADAAPTFVRWMERAGASLLEEADLLAPVPLHRWRLILRRYNQAGLLAAGLAARAGRPVVPDLLLRRRPTRSQGRLSPAARRRNLSGAIAINPARQPLLSGRRVLLIDDVMTSGATVEACTRTLLAAGAGAVDVLVLARVMRPRPN